MSVKKRKRKSRQSTSQMLGERTLQLFELRNVPVFSKTVSLMPYPYVIKQAKYTTCYNWPGRIDAKVFISKHRIINIECKYQDDSGTVDEKFPYVFKCFECASDCSEFILLYDGPWWEMGGKGKAAVMWAKAESVIFERKYRKPVHVLNWDGFNHWLMKEFPNVVTQRDEHFSLRSSHR